MSNKRVKNLNKILQNKIGIEFIEPFETARQSLNLQTARIFTHMVMSAYWAAILSAKGHEKAFRIRTCPIVKLAHHQLQSVATQDKALQIGLALSKCSATEAGYLVGTIYTSLLPDDFCSQNGVYYTPPILTQRLIQQASTAGIDWTTAKVLDPACGGGAFLAPLIEKKLKALAGTGLTPLETINHLSKTVCGYEIDPFSAWLTQIFVDVVTLDLCIAAGKRLPFLTKVKNSLEHMDKYPLFDLVIGNPPYSKVKLDKEDRQQYQRSLYGHANLYGLFTDQALNYTKPGGVVAYVTPSSFLSGQYFKSLRLLLLDQAPPYSIDFVSDRAGVFDNVLQETVLATYRKDANNKTGAVNLLQFNDNSSFEPQYLGRFRLPNAESSPWLMPRTREQADLMSQLIKMPNRLADYGYKVSTGPLVWNRHKSQLTNRNSEKAYPLIWAESITPNGEFRFKAEKKNHKPFFKWQSKKDDWLLTNTPCVLLQRTTSLEQERRLIAAELPAEFITQHGRVVIENHINMIRAIHDKGKISVKTVTAVFNSKTMDQVFRCYNGSVAVSAYELEALPLPPPEVMNQIENIVRFNAHNNMIEQILRDFYLNERTATAA